MTGRNGPFLVEALAQTKILIISVGYQTIPIVGESTQASIFVQTFCVLTQEGCTQIAISVFRIDSVQNSRKVHIRETNCQGVISHPSSGSGGLV